MIPGEIKLSHLELLSWPDRGLEVKECGLPVPEGAQLPVVAGLPVRTGTKHGPGSCQTSPGEPSRPRAAR